MTLLMMEGFELNAYGQIFSNKPLSQNAAVRAGGGGVKSCLMTGDNSYDQYVGSGFSTADTQIFIKFSFYAAALSLYTFRLYNQAGTIVGTYAPHYGTGTICGQTVSCSGVSAGVWFTLDVHVKLHATEGRVTIRKDGVVLFDVQDVDTTQAGVNTGFIQWMMFKNTYGATSVYIDDLVINDSLGDVNNGFMPDVRIVALTPTSDATPNEMTPSAGSSHYALVDEIPASTTDYLESSTAGQEELFGMSDLTLPSGWGILALQMGGYQHETVATGTFYSEFGLMPGSTEYWETDKQHLFATTGAYITSKIYEENPDTDLAWTDSDLDGLVAGIRIAP